ncbi:hypothetical protein [Flavobacterium sp. SORGH_AS_0622]|uniref:hypothetical protein n=1 Tax=Flavobacterium sp. SORGH_AS_0622 TaxID=3041772 RepID=UPI002784A876|nr:hypothetical protein [Flavobacterium sp. SORGH_AS_0622]MDQ1164853.1 hypothetical protein [Flavobacterium sp. SORGH_AS_0622]
MCIKKIIFFVTFLLFPLKYSAQYCSASNFYCNTILYNKFKIKSIDHYRLEIDHAISLLIKKKDIIDQELNRKERVEILAIAFPEIIRYNSFSDYIETSSNRILYINKGKKVSDFSIGYFQMKPSFIEDLENYVIHNTNLEDCNMILIKKKTEKEIRKERIDRLESFQWQIRYLKVFWHVAELKFKNLNFKNKQEKIRFFATAYNYGFTKPENEIENYQAIKAFPYGERINTIKFKFADFSLDFINTYSSFFN